MNARRNVSLTDSLYGFGGADRELRHQDYHYEAKFRPDRPHAVLQLTLGGVGFHEDAAGNRKLLPAGHAFFDLIPGPFQYGWAAGEYDLVFVSVTGPAITALVHSFHRQFGPVVDLGRDVSVARTMLSLVKLGRRGTPEDSFIASGQIYGLIMQLMSVLSRQRIMATPLVAECLKIIHAEAKDPALTVSSLAKRLDRSREHLTREFRSATGVPLSTYLIRSRVRLAANRLRGSSAKLDVIAHESGFGSAAYLCRMFRTVVGTTPTDYRQQPWIAVP